MPLQVISFDISYHTVICDMNVLFWHIPHSCTLTPLLTHAFSKHYHIGCNVPCCNRENNEQTSSFDLFKTLTSRMFIAAMSMHGLDSFHGVVHAFRVLMNNPDLKELLNHKFGITYCFIFVKEESWPSQVVSLRPWLACQSNLKLLWSHWFPLRPSHRPFLHECYANPPKLSIDLFWTRPAHQCD